MEIKNKSKRIISLGSIKLLPNENKLSKEQVSVYKRDKNLQKFAKELSDNGILEIGKIEKPKGLEDPKNPKTEN